jgi:hypothetical protein
MGLFSSSPQKTKSKSTAVATPWDPQQPFLTGGFEAGKDALSGALSGLNGVDMVANLNAGQTRDLRATSALGRGFSAATQGTLGDIQGMLGKGPQVVGQPGLNAFNSNAGQIFNGAGAGPVAGTAQTALDMAKGVGNFNPNIDPSGHAQQVYGDVSGNKFGAVTQQAQAYSNNPHLQGQIDAVLGDVDKAFQTDRGGLNAAASGVGAINSTRTGVMEARMRDDAMDRAARISADMRSGAYSEGLGVAQNMEQLRQGNMLGANGQIQNDDQLRLGEAGMKLDAKTAGLSGVLNTGGLQLDNRSSADSTRLNANAQTGTGAEMANGFANDALTRFGNTLGMNGQAYGQAQQGTADSMTAGTVQQAQQQKEIEGQLLKLGLPLDYVKSYMASIGGGYGGTTHEESKGTTSGGGASIFQQLAGAATSGLGAWKMCWVAREVYGVDNPKWLDFRTWMFTQSPMWLFKLYENHGERFAAFISNKPTLKRVVRRIFDEILKRS